MFRAVRTAGLLLALVALVYGQVSSFTNVWAPLPTTGIAPPALRDARLAVSGDRVYATGGTDASGAQVGKLFTLTPETASWVEFVPAPAPGAVAAPAVAGHVFVASMQQPSELYLFGGCASSCASLAPADRVYVFDRSAASGAGEWQTYTTITFPRRRYGAVAALYNSPSQGEQLVVWGGRTDVDDLAAYHMQTSAVRSGSPWVQYPSSGTFPPQLVGASGVVVDSTLFVYGGVTEATSTYASTLYALSLETHVWASKTISGAPTAVAHAAAGLFLDSVLVVAGGLTTGAVPVATSFALNVTATPASMTMLAASAATRAQAGSVVSQANLLVAGGLVDGVLSDALDVYYTRPAVDALSNTTGDNCGGGVLTVSGRQFVATGSNVCVFGTVAVSATVLSATRLSCVVPQPVVVEAADAVATVAVSVGNVVTLLTPSTAASLFTYTEGPSSPALGATATFEIPTVRAGATTPVPLRTRVACGIMRATALLVPGEPGVFDHIVANATDLTNPSNTFTGTVRAVSAGLYSIDMRTTRAASYALNVYLNDRLLETPTTIVVGPNLPTNANSRTIGAPSTIEAGQSAVFTIESADAYGNPITEPSLFEVIGTAANPLAGAPDIVATGVVSLESGALQANLAPTTAGSYAVAVRVKAVADGGSVVVNAPFSLFPLAITPGPFSVESTTVAGIGAAFATVGVPTSIAIEPRDQFGNAVRVSGVKFDLALTGSSEINGSVVELPETGLYNATYETTRVGQYAIGITVDNTPVTGSPFTITVKLADDPAPTQAIAFGSGIRGVVAGKTGYFTVQARDKWDNTFDRGGMAMSIKAKFITKSQAFDNGDGSYVLWYTAKHLGHFGKNKMHVLANGISIAGSPFRVKVQYGIVFLLIVLFAVLLGSICLAIVCSYVCADMYRRYKAQQIARNPKNFFPDVMPDDHAADAPWINDPSYLDPQQGVQLHELGFAPDDLMHDFDRGDEHVDHAAPGAPPPGALGPAGAAERNAAALDAIART